MAPVGFGPVIADRTQGFLLDGGAFVLIDVAGATPTIAWGINSRGDIVGSAHVGPAVGGTTYGFLAQ